MPTLQLAGAGGLELIAYANFKTGLFIANRYTNASSKVVAEIVTASKKDRSIIAAIAKVYVLHTTFKLYGISDFTAQTNHRGVIENLGLGYDCCGFHCRRSRQGINLSLQCP